MLKKLHEGHLGEHQVWDGGSGHSWRCCGLQHLLECLLALCLLLREGIKAQLLLVAQEKCLVLGLV